MGWKKSKERNKAKRELVKAVLCPITVEASNTWTCSLFTGESLPSSCCFNTLNILLRMLLMLYFKQAAHHPFAVSFEYFRNNKSYGSSTKRQQALNMLGCHFFQSVTQVILKELDTFNFQFIKLLLYLVVVLESLPQTLFPQYRWQMSWELGRGTWPTAKNSCIYHGLLNANATPQTQGAERPIRTNTQLVGKPQAAAGNQTTLIFFFLALRHWLQPWLSK